MIDQPTIYSKGTRLQKRIRNSLLDSIVTALLFVLPHYSVKWMRVSPFNVLSIPFLILLVTLILLVDLPIENQIESGPQYCCMSSITREMLSLYLFDKKMDTNTVKCLCPLNLISKTIIVGHRFKPVPRFFNRPLTVVLDINRNEPITIFIGIGP